MFYLYFFFFFNDTATTEIYTLSLHDALPISPSRFLSSALGAGIGQARDSLPGYGQGMEGYGKRDRKSTRLNSSHSQISYAVFRLKKKHIFQSMIIPTDRHINK